MSTQPVEPEVAVIEAITYRETPAATLAAVERIADMRAESPTWRIARAARPSERLQAL